MTTAPPKAPPPSPPKPTAKPPTPSNAAARSFDVTRGVQNAPLKVIIYGAGGIGKTELAANLAAVNVRPLFLDLEGGSHYLDVDRIDGIGEWQELRDVLHGETVKQFDAVVIDSLTKAEELATAWTLANVPHEKGTAVKSIEGYGFGKGVTHVYETFLNVLGDLDALVRRGVHVICIAHDCTAAVPNPEGEDWIRYEPRLQSPPSGKASIRHRVKEWADHVLFIGYDKHVDADGKAKGSGSRCIYPCERPAFIAKSRTLATEIVYERGSCELWQQLLPKGK